MDTNNLNDRFIRWQTTTIEERGKSINLFLSLSLATIGFLISQIANKDFHFINQWANVFICLGSLLLMACIGLMIFLTINRLRDFDETKNILRAKIKAIPQEQINALRIENKATGSKTRKCLNYAICFFGIGEFFIVIGLLIQLKDKIF